MILSCVEFREQGVKVTTGSEKSLETPGNPAGLSFWCEIELLEQPQNKLRTIKVTAVQASLLKECLSFAFRPQS